MWEAAEFIISPDPTQPSSSVPIPAKGARSTDCWSQTLYRKFQHSLPMSPPHIQSAIKWLVFYFSKISSVYPHYPGLNHTTTCNSLRTGLCLQLDSPTMHSLLLLFKWWFVWKWRPNKCFHVFPVPFKSSPNSMTSFVRPSGIWIHLSNSSSLVYH